MENKERSIEEKRETRKKSKKGVGRLPKYGEPTSTMAFRYPISKKEEIKEHIEIKLKEWRII